MFDGLQDYEFTTGNLEWYSGHVNDGIDGKGFTDCQMQTASLAEPTSEASEAIIIDQCTYWQNDDKWDFCFVIRNMRGKGNCITEQHCPY